MKKIITIILCTISIIACKEKTIFTSEPIQISHFPKTITPSAEKIDIEIIGINNLYIVDTILLGFKSKRRGWIFYMLFFT